MKNIFPRLSKTCYSLSYCGVMCWSHLRDCKSRRKFEETVLGTGKRDDSLWPLEAVMVVSAQGYSTLVQLWARRWTKFNSFLNLDSTTERFAKRINWEIQPLVADCWLYQNDISNLSWFDFLSIWSSLLIASMFPVCWVSYLSILWEQL